MPNARIQEADEVLTFARTELGKYYRMVTGDDLADDAAILTVDNALDDLAVQRIINVPRRGIGAATISRVEEHAREQGINF